MTPNEFKALRSQNGAQRPTAKALGIGFRTLQRVEDGTMGDPIPEKYAMMIHGLRSRAKG